jgi:branched-chain amino acid transport system substrate-binding protein
LSGEIKVGAIETLTGNNSPFGISIKNGQDLAVSEINASKFLGNATINLITLDDKGDKQEGISVMTKLLNQEKVVSVLGPTLSSTAFAADPVAQKAGIPVLATSNTADGITQMGDFIFRDSLPEAGVIPGTIAAVKAKLNPKKAAMMYESTNEFTKSAADVFKKELDKNGIQLTGNEAYSKGDTDFRTQLNKLKAASPDILIVSGLIGEAVPIVQQAREVGFTQPIVGGNGFNTPAIYTQGKEAAEGIIVGSAWFLGSTNPKSQAFVAAYKAKYNADPDQFAAQAYTGAYLMATAIKNADSTDPKAIRDALAQIKDYDSVLGKFSFDANRDPVHQPVTVIVKGGKFELFQ